MLINEVVSPVFHNKSPLAVVDNMEFPQLLMSDTDGLAGAVLGAAIPLPARLTHPFIVALTVYERPSLTVTDGVVAPLLHSIAPVALVVKVDIPQLFTTDIPGAAGPGAGRQLAPPARLVQPLTVVVTVYRPPAYTVMDGVVAPVL